ncbi:DnaJ domain-containing protein [Haloarcula sp. Atlit-7R]|uniref:DnaJ domain-containing protein n=1 Tax=Haloarcula sp. Atlit-7R TaxID=2282125 RepID=UPI000EF16035|nr:DnaJ domain-containing protein [Haloarcula sp. Atlit-7R]RLM94345.1 hypothetical protein D3D01_15905 [Haloarcula sp. Atlit-7R]
MKRSVAAKVLDVSETAAESEIEEAYRTAVKSHHPDVSDEPNATEKFLRAKKAKETLLNNQPGEHRRSVQDSEEDSQDKTESNKQRSSQYRRRRKTYRKPGEDTNGTNTNSSDYSTTSDWRSERQRRKGGKRKSRSGTDRHSRTEHRTQTQSQSKTKTQSQSQSQSQTDQRSSTWTTPLAKEFRGSILSILAGYVLIVCDGFLPPKVTRSSKVDEEAFRSAPNQLLTALTLSTEKCVAVLKQWKSGTAFISSVIGVTPAIILTEFYRPLSWAEGAATVTLATAVYVGAALYLSTRSSIQIGKIVSQPTEQFSIDRWSPLGELQLLVLYGLSYAIITTINPGLLYMSLQFFPILLIYSLPVAYILDRFYTNISNNVSGTIFGYKGQVGTLCTSMVITGGVVHMGPLVEISPSVLLNLDPDQLPFATLSANGILISISSASLYLFLSPVLEVLDIGWVRCLKDWEENLLGKFVWNSIVSIFVGVLLWTVLPTTAAPQLHIWFRHAIIGTGLFLYVYGIVTS